MTEKVGVVHIHIKHGNKHCTCVLLSFLWLRIFNNGMHWSHYSQLVLFKVPHFAIAPSSWYLEKSWSTNLQADIIKICHEETQFFLSWSVKVTQQAHGVVSTSTSMRRNDVASTLVRRQFHVICPLGIFQKLSLLESLNRISPHLFSTISYKGDSV